MYLTRKTWISLTGLLTAFITIYTILKQNPQINSTIKPPIPLAYKWKSRNHVKMIEVAAWRTGSSFLGEMISQFPETFYSYEPLHLFSGKVGLEANHS